jgi:hypothetical protein
MQENRQPTTDFGQYTIVLIITQSNRTIIVCTKGILLLTKQHSRISNSQ